MPHPRTIAQLLWAGPVYAVAYFAMGATFSELRDTNPLFYGVLMMPLGILLVIAAFGIWAALRTLAGRHTPVATLRHIPFGELRLRADEILPAAAGLTVAWPALLYIAPLVAAFPSPSQIYVIQAPGAFSGLFVAWAIRDMPVSRRMKIYQVLTPVLLVLSVPLQVGVAGEGPYITTVARAVGLLYFAWLFITPLWLAGLMRQQSAPAG